MSDSILLSRESNLLAEFLLRGTENGNWFGPVFTDSRSATVVIRKDTESLPRRSRHVAIRLAQAKEQLKNRLLWCSTESQMADGLTKLTSAPQVFSLLFRPPVTICENE